jgi:hypothetical protein
MSFFERQNKEKQGMNIADAPRVKRRRINSNSVEQPATLLTALIRSKRQAEDTEHLSKVTIVYY